MKETKRLRIPLWAFLLAFVFVPATSFAGIVPVRYAEGLTHGFLVLRTLDGDVIADGDMTQVAVGSRITDHVVFHFKDGSMYDETFVFTQSGTFRLLTDDPVQKGPSFKPSNGMPPILLKDINPSECPWALSLVATTPKPRLVKLAVSHTGDESFSAGAAGVVAPLVGKQPPGTNVWIYGGDAPVFLKLECALFEGDSIWRLEVVAPVFSQTSSGK